MNFTDENKLIIDKWHDILNELKKFQKLNTNLLNNIKKLESAYNLNDIYNLSRFLNSISEVESPQNINSKLDLIKKETLNFVTVQKDKIKKDFLIQLEKQSQEKNKRFSRLTTYEFAINPFTLLISWDEFYIDFSYSRQLLERISLNIEEIWKVYDRYFDKFHKSCVNEKEVFEKIFSSYRAVIGIEQKRAGDRIMLVDIIPILSVIGKTRKENISIYSRAQLCWDINYLRAKGALEQKGFRLQIGPATGGSAQNKQNVIWIENNSGQGGWYLTLWFSRVEDETKQK